MRRAEARAIAEVLSAGRRAALVTHVNADGDGVGSEVALWHALAARGVRAAIANPTPVPERFGFLFEGIGPADKSSAAAKYLEGADVIIVVDISDLSRLGHLGTLVGARDVPVICIDHHVSQGALPEGPRMVDATACATGELVYDLFRALKWEITPAIATSLYVAILTDTGGFRFSNTTARTLHVAGELVDHGVDPEEIYSRVYASNPEGRIRLLTEVLETLVVEHDTGLAWVTIPNGALERHGLRSEHLEGVVELPRSIEGVRLALQFRRIANGRIKISFRSVGAVDAAGLAERFGGGGHRKAAGASLEGSLAEVQAVVIRAAREALIGG